ncbi:MAG TPA: RNA-binding cell elongation regulator Jag/EloR [Chloroflexota bacterium]
MESVEVSARTVDEAVEQALIRLGKARDEVEVTVLSEGHRRILGFVRGENARVRVTALESAEVSPARQAASPRPSAPRPTARASRARTAAPKAAPVETAPLRVEGAAAVAKDTTEELLDNMGIDAAVIFRGGSGEDESPIVLDVVGDDLGILIGRRGETLSSIQFLVNLIVGKRLESWVRVVIDVEGYRARREESLRALAGRVAERVQRTGQSVALEPMPANERRIVHMALQDDASVTTESSGYGEDRHVNVIPRNR